MKQPHAIIDGYTVPVRSACWHEGEIVNLTVRMNHKTFTLWHPNVYVPYWHDQDSEEYKVEFPEKEGAKC